MDKTVAGVVLLQALSSGDAAILDIAFRGACFGFAAITRAESMPVSAPAPESVGAIGKTKVGTRAAAFGVGAAAADDDGAALDAAATDLAFGVGAAAADDDGAALDAAATDLAFGIGIAMCEVM
jgi:hypothetical protein